MKKLLISTFAVATMALTGVVTVAPVINNQQAHAVPTPAEAWKTNHAAILAKTVDQITLTDEAKIKSAVIEYDSLSDTDKEAVATEYAHLTKLNVRYFSLKWKDDHSAILAKTETNVVEADWTAIDNAFKEYRNINLLNNEKQIFYLKPQTDHLIKLIRKISSPESIAVADKYNYFATMPLDKVTADNIVDYHFLIQDMDDLSGTDSDKVEHMLFEVTFRINKVVELVNQQYPETVPPENAEGDAKDDFLIALRPYIFHIGNLRINKIALVNSQATKMTGVKQKNIVWSRNIELLDKNDKLIPLIVLPMRIYLKITDQKVIDLIKAGKIEMVHVHKKTDGTFETMKTPFVFNEHHNVVAFSTEKFSEFALVKKYDKNGNLLPNSGFGKTTTSLFTIVATLTLGGALALISKR